MDWLCGAISVGILEISLLSGPAEKRMAYRRRRYAIRRPEL
jgi:hypothetical protein